MTAVPSRAGATWLIAVLTAILVVASAVSLDAAFDAPAATWLVPSAVPAVLGLVGAAVARSLGGRMLRPLVVGLVTALAAWCLQWWPETLLAGLVPGPVTVAALADTAVALRETIWTDAIPVVPGPPVLAGVGLALALTALVTDAVAVGLRSPALAGLPPLALVGGCAVITAGATPWPALALAAAAWLALLAVGSDAVLARIHREDAPARSGVSGAGTAVAGVVAVAGLVLAATQLPYLATGLAPEGRRFVLGPGSGPVDPAADLGRELRSSTGYAGITYETEDGRGLYLRTAVVDDVTASPWQAVPPRYSGPPTTTAFSPAAVRLAGGGEQLLAEAAAGGDPSWDQVTVTLDGWPGNWAPLPDQAWTLEEVVGDWGWQVDPSTSVAYRREATPVDLEYRSTVVPLDLTLDQLAVRAGRVAPQGIYDRWGADPALADSSIQGLAEEVTAGSGNPVEQAAAIQAYLLSDRFTYSETAPVERGYDGSGIELTEQFLQAGAGYCVHFSSAMAMLAQAVDIPARVVVGYAPVGTTEGVHRVTSDRAHSWPELYIDGVGWVPFEPTPGVGRSPAYADLGGTGIATPEPDPTVGAPEDLPASSGEPTGSAADDAGAGDDRGPDGFGNRALGPAPAALVIVAVLAVIAALPRWVRRRRRHRRLGGDGTVPLRHAVREAWREVEDTAVDLRLGRRPPEAEPAFAARLAGVVGAAGPEAPGPAGDAAALADAIAWVRYAGDGTEAPAGADRAPDRARALIAGLERAAAPAVRRRARWLPASLVPTTPLTRQGGRTSGPDAPGPDGSTGG